MSTKPTTKTMKTTAVTSQLGDIWDMTKIPKESIGLVNACTLNNPKIWSTFNGEQFCGVEKKQLSNLVLYPEDFFDRKTADSTCKAEVIYLWFLSLYLVYFISHISDS